MQEANTFFFFKEWINRKQLNKAAAESFELVLSWVPVCLFQKPYSGMSTSCMKKPRVSHFWSQELKDQIINSSWLSVCWSSLPEGLNILPDSLWWLLYTLFITLQLGTHKAATWSSLGALAQQSFLNTTSAELEALFRGAEQCWVPVSVLFPSILPLFGGCCCWLVLQSAGCARACVKVKITLFALFLVSACLPMFDVDWDGPSPTLFNTYRLFWVRAGGPTRAIHFSSGLWAWCPAVKWLGMCGFLSAPLPNMLPGCSAPCRVSGLAQVPFRQQPWVCFRRGKAHSWNIWTSYPTFWGVRQESLRSGGEKINMDIAHLESCKDCPWHQQCSSCGVTSCATPLLEQEEEHVEKRPLCFQQQLQSWVECQRVMLPCWRPALSLSSILWELLLQCPSWVTLGGSLVIKSCCFHPLHACSN